MSFILTDFNAVIFDMDGVLINSEPFYREVEQLNFRKLGLRITPEEHNTYQGTATDRMWKIIIKKHGLSQTVQELVNMTNSVVTPYFQNLETLKPMPGVLNLIQTLSNKSIPLAVASSSHKELIEIVLHKTGLKKYFSAIVDSQSAGSSKPEPDIFLLAANQLGINPKKCAVIEDSTNGIKAAKLAGMYCIAFAGPGSEFQNQDNADFIISEFKELLI